MTDVSERLRDASANARNRAEDTVENVRSGVMTGADQVSDTLRARTSEAMEAGRDALDRATDTTLSMADAVKSSIERQPLAAVSFAAAAGFLFGMLFFRRG